MKKTLLVLVAFTSMMSSAAFAHGNKFSMTAESIAAAGEKFEKEHADQLASFTGVKGWVDNDKIQVKVYLTDNKTVQYTCSMMEMNGSEMMMCDQAQ